jgi:hypothetical protein
MKLELEEIKMKWNLLSLLVIGLLMIPLTTNALDISSDELLLYLPFDEGEGNIAKDLSKNQNDAELVDTVNWVDGKIGKALEFSEAGEVKAPYIPLNERSFTVCMWLNPNLVGGAEQVVFSQTQVNAQNTSLHYRIYTNGTARMGFYSNDLDAPGTVEAGVWSHICFWLDVEGESRKIYINGEEVAQDAGLAGIAYLGNAGDTIIGSWGATGQQFNGVIDEVQVWGKALTEDEIQQSMESLVTSATSVDALGKLAATWGRIKDNKDLVR